MTILDETQWKAAWLFARAAWRVVQFALETQQLLPYGTRQVVGGNDMAGDWIKMRSDLLTSPKVVRIMSALKADKFRTIGGLFAVWSLFDAHTEDGKMAGITPENLSEMVSMPGIGEAMLLVGWIEHDGQTLTMPRFESHNGMSAKRRAQDAERKKNVRKVSAKCPQEKRTECGPEKRREEKITTYIAPTIEEFKDYCAKHGFSHIADRAYSGYAESGWKDSNGKPVKNWKSKLQHVWFDKAKNPPPAILGQPQKAQAERFYFCSCGSQPEPVRTCNQPACANCHAIRTTLEATDKAEARRIAAEMSASLKKEDQNDDEPF